MDIGFLFGWAEEEGVDLPTKADGSINIPAAFALYDEWKKKGGGGKEKDGNGKFNENGLSSGGKSGKINLTKQEWAQYYRFVNDPQNKGAVFKKPNGERLVRLENKIVVDDGDSVRRVMVFPNNDSMNDLINEMLDRGNLQWE